MPLPVGIESASIVRHIPSEDAPVTAGRLFDNSLSMQPNRDRLPIADQVLFCVELEGRWHGPEWELNARVSGFGFDVQLRTAGESHSNVTKKRSIRS
jgi:hypothetical protein